MTNPFVGKVIGGGYEIQARVDEGHMGVVYKTRQPVAAGAVIASRWSP